MVIKAIIGLGNPGARFDNTRHNIGFALVDELAHAYGGLWKEKDAMQVAQVCIDGHDLLLIKPQTYMNNSGQVIAALTKKGIKPEEILVVHDELELPFGQIKYKSGGGHKGHNGLRSIIDAGARECQRIRFGIGRPENKDDVSDYVLMKFKEPQELIQEKIQEAIQLINHTIDEKEEL